MTDRKDNSAYEESIRPINPGRVRADEQLAAPSAGGGRRIFLQASGALVLLVAVGFVFFVLPDWVAEEEPAEPAVVEQAPPQASEPVEEPLSAEEIEALRQESQRYLARLLTQQPRLVARGIEDWGGEGWTRYRALSREGDDAYLVEDFAASSSSYREALELGDDLLGQSRQFVADALARGQAAIDAGDSAGAVAEFESVFAVEPENQTAVRGLERARALPDVLKLVARGATLEEEGQLEAAAEVYREALAVDPNWRPARSRLNAVAATLERNRFEGLMSSGFVALSESEFGDALESFEEALQMRPQASEPLDGIAQAQAGIEARNISLARTRAMVFERRELWDQAMEQYLAALETDSTLQYAIEGLERSRYRNDLNVKLENLLENPTVLFDAEVVAQARALIEEAQGVEITGPRIEDQVDRLSRLINLATTPQMVQLRSDAMTNVTVYRVGELGTFTAKEIEVRPGSYTVVGSRNGYRDVRKTFTVLPGRTLEPVTVICEEPI